MKLEDINVNGKKIITDKLLLRPLKQDDLEGFSQYLNGGQEGQNEKAQEILSARIAEHRTFAITEKSGKKIVGTLSFEKSDDLFADKDIGQNINEICFTIAKEYWGNGYASQAVRAAVCYAFYVLKLEAVTACHFAESDATKTALLKNKFRFITEGKLKDDSGEERDCWYYALTHLEFGVDYSE